MELMRRTARAFREECRAFPQNAKLFSDEVLLEVLEQDAPPRAKAVALAELAVRQMLSPRRYEGIRSRFDVAKALGERFGTREFARFRDACERCAVSTNVAHAAERAFGCLRGDGEALHVSALMVAFRPWLEAEGVIPVFDAQGAYLLPFSFVTRVSGEGPRVVDDVGVEIPAWTQHFRAFADVEGIGLDVRVAIQRNQSVCGTGNSMMLPVLMAWWRREGALPRYDVLRFVATGAYEGQRLGLVDTNEKEALVATGVAGGLLVRPGSGLRRGEIPVGVGRDALLQHLRVLAEENYDCSPTYAYERLSAYEQVIRERHWGDWSSLADRLGHLLAGVTEKDPEERLWGLMLRSAAFCHAGQTEKAHEFNAEAAKLAARKPERRPQLLRLQIEELVILQDEEDFEKIYRLAPELEKEVESFAAAEGKSGRAVDLQMRYWGTMGQFWLYDAVARRDAALAERSREALERALDCAHELYARSKRANGGRAECSAYANCAQDANYRLLWAAFFGRQGAADEARCAKGEADSLRSDGEDERGADKNDAFRRRILALAKYRSVLAGDAEVPVFLEDAETEEMAERDVGWVAATACKYLGAAAAARGDGACARKWFDCALGKMQAIREEGWFYGLVMRVIHMTVLAEAYRSLRVFDAQRAFAQRCRADALSMFAAEGAETWRKDGWKAWLEAEGGDEAFPGKAYWY